MEQQASPITRLTLRLKYSRNANIPQAFFFFDLSITNPIEKHKKHKSATPANTGTRIANS
uniref:Uncharacterized protein n=1 Tax=Nelumbo nucifera TaxID=4432 RepID=A0A822YZD2_NELNU|nr:TPA_asm: hypothetical protein HUJ06_007226 [Nelumbo nucifera]